MSTHPLRTVAAAADLRAAIAAARRAGRAIGFVPTMGALHAGHVSLIHAAKQRNDFVVVSIYVNPTQFGPHEDFNKYPRPITADTDACQQAGADLLFTPDHTEMYPPGDQTRVRPGRLADHLCGPFRPGHFEGVCTVVAKLFNLVQPDRAYFGQKDAQQSVIIRRMVRDLAMPVTIEVCPIVREPDGLAMSSRNAYLSPEDRARSLCLYRALCTARDRLQSGERALGKIIAAMRTVIAAAGDIRVDYLSLVDPDTLEPINGAFAAPQSASPPASNRRILIAGAIRLGSTRLIDNLIVSIP